MARATTASTRADPGAHGRLPVQILAAQLGDDPKIVLSTDAHLLPQSDERVPAATPSATLSRPRDTGRAMSQENVEITRRFFKAGQRSLDAYWENPRSGVAAFEAGDLRPEDEAVLVFLHPEVEYNAVPSALEGGTAHGHLGWVKSWDAFLGASEHFGFTIEEVADLGSDKVFVAAEITARWKGSGMTLTEPRFSVVALRDGLIVRIDAFRDNDEALEAAGLSE